MSDELQDFRVKERIADMSETDVLRAEANRYREAALIAYGALLARPDSSRELIALLSKYLAPDLGTDQPEE